MDDTTDSTSSVPNPFAWSFLNEPLWRWFLFIIALGLMLHAWRSVLNEMS